MAHLIPTHPIQRVMPMRTSNTYFLQNLLFLLCAAALPFSFGCGDSNQDEDAAVCGNGVVDPGESCDDGNTDSLDGCSATCSNEPMMCQTSEDCGDSKRCVASRATPGAFICGAPSSCGSLRDETEQDSYCHSSTPGTICAPDAETPDTLVCREPLDCSEVTDAAAYCATELGELPDYQAASCDTSGAPTCKAIDVGPRFDEDERHYILIHDFTDSGCDLPTDPGSDIMYVELSEPISEESTGNISYDHLEWGTAVNAQFGAQSFYSNLEIIDGTPPQLDADGCPNYPQDIRFSGETVVSLGCGGYMLVEFDAALVDDMLLTVGEYAPYCNSDKTGSFTGSDQYDVFLCPAAKDGDLDKLMADCWNQPYGFCSNTAGGIKSCIVNDRL